MRTALRAFRTSGPLSPGGAGRGLGGAGQLLCQGSPREDHVQRHPAPGFVGPVRHLPLSGGGRPESRGPSVSSFLQAVAALTIAGSINGHFSSLLL